MKLTRIVGLLLCACGIAYAQTPPNIITPPSSLTVTQNSSATFTVAATGDDTLTYQWRKNGGNITDATNAVYTIASAQSIDAANYDVIVSNSGSVTSSVATLTVLIPPSITQQPVSATTTQGFAFSFSVTATGDPTLTYQWRKNGGNLSGANSSTYTVGSAVTGDAGNYDVIVANGSGSVTSSPVATLTVLVPVSISVNPTSITRTNGGSASFSVTAGGTSPTYQWRKNGNNLGGANSSTYSIGAVTAGDAGGYDVIVANSVNSVTSTVATLTVLIPPSISSGPNSLTVTQGNLASFTVNTTGDLPQSFLWRKAGVVITNSPSNVFTIVSATTNDAATYSVIVSNSSGTATSGGALLTVLVPPFVITNPVNVTTFMGNSARFAVVAGGDATLTYQWRLNGSPVANDSIASGATTATLSLTNVTLSRAGNYDVVIANNVGSITSQVATLTITPIFGISFDFNTAGQFTNTPYNNYFNNFIDSGNAGSQYTTPCRYTKLRSVVLARSPVVARSIMPRIKLPKTRSSCFRPLGTFRNPERHCSPL